jgi:hypothetical protein
MGCGSSRESALQTVDDSVHVMLAHDRKVQKAKGEKPHGYVPRAEHPLLKPKMTGTNVTATSDTTATIVQQDGYGTASTGTCDVISAPVTDDTTTTTTTCATAPAAE